MGARKREHKMSMVNGTAVPFAHLATARLFFGTMKSVLRVFGYRSTEKIVKTWLRTNYPPPTDWVDPGMA